MAASASAPGGEPQKQLLSIIRDFAAEKSHGERTVSGLKRRLDDVVAEADAAAAELEAAKRARDAAETALRGSQVQASIAAAKIQALEATISHLQEEITKVGSELEELKSKEDSERDEFLSQMLEMNAKIRQFQKMASAELAGKWSELSADGNQGKATEGNQGKATDGYNVGDKNETAESEGMLTDLADKVSSVEAELHAWEEEYQKDLLEHKKLCQEVADARAKRALMEAVMEETKQLQELGGYPFYHQLLQQFWIFHCIFCIYTHASASSSSVCVCVLSLTRRTRVAELEKVYSSVAEELQTRYVCPGCGTNNMPHMEEEPAASN